MRSAGQLAALSAPLFAFSQLSFRTFLRTLTSWFRSNPSDSIFFSIFRRAFCRAAFSGTFLRIAEFSGTRSIKDWAATCVPKRVKHEVNSITTCECEKKQSKPLHSLFINLLYTLLVTKKLLFCIFLTTVISGSLVVIAWMILYGRFFARHENSVHASAGAPSGVFFLGRKKTWNNLDIISG